MKGAALLIAAIGAALVVYDQTAARSNDPSPRAVSGGPELWRQRGDRFQECGVGGSEDSTRSV